MNYKIMACLLLLLGLNACTSNNQPPAATETQVQTSQGRGTLVIKTITFDQQAVVRDAVKNECNLLTKLTGFIAEDAAAQYAQVITDSNKIPKDAQVLEVKIADVYGGGGGAWSGGKSVLIKGKLSQRGKVLGTFRARRHSGGGMFAMYKGTCSILGRCVRTLGKDVAKWLTRPTAKALLGDS